MPLPFHRCAFFCFSSATGRWQGRGSDGVHVFFRDAEVLETAVRHALPILRGQAFIHIWDAGCAHGPEPYTLAIILHQQMSEFVFRNVRIHATDVDVTFEQFVRDGIYHDKELRRIPGNLRDRYFLPHGSAGDRQVIDDLRGRVNFVRHDLCRLNPCVTGWPW